jgi:tripartite-type tricarboxylate transporter receptor subunit TctC
VKIGAALWLFTVAVQALAQPNYPEQTVRILVGFSPGVAPDVTSRLLAERLASTWGKAVVVENVTGAGGNIATDRVAKAAPTGYTLGMIGNGSLVFSPSLYEKLSFDPLKDFAPITRVFVAANVLVIPAEVPAKTLPELVALLRAQRRSCSSPWRASTSARWPIAARRRCCPICSPDASRSRSAMSRTCCRRCARGASAPSR